MNTTVRRAPREDLDSVAFLFDPYRPLCAQSPSLERARRLLVEGLGGPRKEGFLECALQLPA